MATGEPQTLKWLTKEMGLDGKPELLDEAAWAALVERGEINRMFRGVEGAESLQRSFQSGEFFIGRGMYGHGTYTASEGHFDRRNSLIPDTTTRKERVFNSLSTARDYAQRESGYVIEMALKPSARTVEWDNPAAQSAFKEWQDKQINATRALRAIDEQTANKVFMFDDVGDFSVWAAQQGYDAFIITGDSYVVVLNRASLYVRRRIFRGDTPAMDILN
tara:strand:- start:2695 stop:3351 length:657 start_codon:yes stop_codon:yes gene_type:complete